MAARVDPAASMTAQTSATWVSRSGRRSSGTGIGEAGSPPVEDDQAPDGRQPPALAGQLRDLPERLDVMHPALDQHQVERALAHDLVREVDVAVLRVLGRGPPVHGAPAWQSPPRHEALGSGPRRGDKLEWHLQGVRQGPAAAPRPRS